MRRACLHAPLALALFGTGCAFIELEPAPYAPRALQVVYSAQEDLTFLAWELDGEAYAGSVTFELAEAGGWRAIDLASAPFPAEPYPCGGGICFQYQLPGRFVPPADRPLLRAIHPRFGVFASRPATLDEVSETFSVEPIAVDRNRRADPRRVDWFADEGVPLERDYRWRLVQGACGEAPAAEFAPMGELVELPEGWTEGPACFEAAPARADAPGAIVQVPLAPSAATRLLERQRYDAPELAHATLYGVLFDLAVADPARCADVRSAIGGRIASAIAANDPHAVSVGEFEPDDAPDCGAAQPARFPVARMLAAAQEAALATTGAKTILWIYVSNRAGSNPAFDEAWAALLEDSAALTPSPVYAWTIAHVAPAPRGGDAPAEAGWNTPYRPIEDPTLFDDIDTVAAQATPFRTLDHDLDTRVPLALGDVPRPEYGRICLAVPQLATLEVDGSIVEGDTFAWPLRDAPLYTVDLGTQIGVPDAAFVSRFAEVSFEICERFCDGPVRTRGGVDHESWLEAGECAGHP